MLRMLGPLVVYFVFVANAFAQPTDLLAGARLAKDLEFPAKPPS